LTQEKINQTITEKFTLEKFLEGPDGITRLVFEDLLNDPDTDKSRILFTDINRRNCQYVDSDGNLRCDPGFQMTHKMISEPLKQANHGIFVNNRNKDKVMYEFIYEDNAKTIKDLPTFVNGLNKMYSDRICFNSS